MSHSDSSDYSDLEHGNTRHSVGVVVVNYNAGDWLQRSVGVALSATDIRQLVVVDNASSDQSLERLQAKVNDPRLRIIRNSDNSGFGSAVNTGIAELSTTYVLLLNPDCFIRSTTIDALVKVLDEHATAAICGPVVLDVNGCEQRGSRRREPTPLRAIARTFGQSAESGGAGFDLNTTELPEQPISVDAVSGSCMLLRKAEFEALGGMDEAFFLHCEDLDLCRRFRDANKQVLFVPSTSVIHLQGGSGRNPKVEWYKHRSMLRYHAKHAASEVPRWLTVALQFGVWSRFVLIALPRALLGRFKARSAPSPERLLSISPGRSVVVTGFGQGASIALGHVLSQQGLRVLAAVDSATTETAPEIRQWEKSFVRSPENSSVEIPIVVNTEYFNKVVSNELGPVDLLYSFGSLSELQHRLPLYARHEIRSIIAVTPGFATNKQDLTAIQTLTGVADQFHIRLIVLKPSITYGNREGADLYQLQQLSRRFSMLAMLGNGEGLRQPLHIDDLLTACQSVARNPKLKTGSYDIGGAETVAHMAMLESVLAGQQPPARLYRVPPVLAAVFSKVLAFLGFSRKQGWHGLVPDPRDHICDNRAAAADFGFRPRMFNGTES